MSKTTRERLGQDDAQILRLESPVLKGHTGKVLVIAPGAGGRPCPWSGFATWFAIE